MNPTNNNIFPYSYQQIPLFPIYGYDNSEEAERDFDYMKQLYPRSSMKIQELIEDTCDRLEYEGSIMFDEYPDRLQISLLAGNIYSQLVPSALPAEENEDDTYIPTEADPPLTSADRPISPIAPFPPGCPNPPCRPPFRPPARPVPPIAPPPPGCPNPPCRPPFRPPVKPPVRPVPPIAPLPPGNPDWLRNMIEIMLCNEMCQRRRRYRSRRRWM